MRRQSRHPQIGDMIVRKYTADEAYQNGLEHQAKNFIGVVYEIKHDKWGHANKVRVQWSNDIPPGYNIYFGYSGVNIHNLRQEYDVIRDGINIP